MDEIANKTKKSLYWQTILPLLWQLGTFALSIITARLLDPRDFGIMGIASIIILYSNKLTEFGFTNSLIQRKEIESSHIDVIFTLNILMSVILTLATFLLAPYIASEFEIPELKNVIKVMSVVFLITSFVQIPESLLKRDVNYKFYSILSIIQSIVMSAITLALAYFSFGYWSLIAGFVISYALYALALTIMSTWKIRFRFSLKILKDIFNFSMWNFVLMQFSMLNEYADKFIVGRFLGPSVLGIYEKAYQIAYMPILNISMKINGIMFSTFSRYQDNQSRLVEYFYKIVSLNTLVCFPILWGLVSVDKYFIYILLGEKWMSIVPPLRILVSAFSFRVLIGLMDSLIISSGDYRLHIKIRSGMIILLISLMVFFVGKGINYIAILVMFFNLIIFILSFIIARKHIELPIFNLIKYMGPSILLTSIMYLTIRILSKTILSDMTLLNLSLLVGIGVVLYISSFFVFNFKATQYLKSEVQQKLKVIMNAI